MAGPAGQAQVIINNTMFDVNLHPCSEDPTVYKVLSNANYAYAEATRKDFFEKVNGV